MRTVNLGGTLEVSALGLGCMGMSEFYGEADEAESLRVLDRALELGVTFYDTADVYGMGHNEVRAMADERGVTPAQLALAWVLAQGPDVAPIPGTKRVRYLEENLGALDTELTDKDLAAIEGGRPQGRLRRGALSGHGLRVRGHPDPELSGAESTSTASRRSA
jgi:bacteriocin-like protein